MSLWTSANGKAWMKRLSNVSSQVECAEQPRQERVRHQPRYDQKGLLPWDTIGVVQDELQYERRRHKQVQDAIEEF